MGEHHRRGRLGHACGSVTIREVRDISPMLELTVDGRTAATRKLMVRY